jgi:hypothetical protein
LLAELLLNRFIYYDQAELKIIYEENSNVRLQGVEAKAALTYFYLYTQSSRRPARIPKIEVGKKREEPCLSVIDCMLGVLGGYAIDPTKRQQGLFERIRDQYRLIVSIPTGRMFSRKEPFKPWPGGDPTKYK